MKAGILVILIIAVSLLNCQQKASEPQTTAVAAVIQPTATEVDYGLLKMYCYPCHSPSTPSHDAILAPPMEAVKYRYKLNYQDKESFVNAITSMMLNPQKEKALMNRAVAQFGLMNATALSEEKIRKIAAYIYDNELEKPVWFQEHFDQEHGVKAGTQKQ
ncbi:MAG: hypothetical protein JNM57_06910 [Cyclobacteriaceae bacterium]|nr:hypothetical protein [Cyclobacteriaceae bacterium]